MAESTQIPEMDATHIAERHIVERYLAGRLADDEALAFEAYVEAHPEVIRQIEIVARMKSGLATLKGSGELAKLMAVPKRSVLRRPAVLAASIAAVAIAILLVIRPWNAAAPAISLAGTPQLLAGFGHEPLPIAAQLTLMRSRGVEIQTLGMSPDGQSAVELTLDLRSPDTAARYSVQLLRVAGASLESLATVSDLLPRGDGALVIYVRADTLKAGSYLIRATEAAHGNPVEFALRVIAVAP